MTKESIREEIAKDKKSLRVFRVKSLSLFGSAARDELTAESDLDFLVEFNGPSTFDNFMNLKFYLEERLGRPVDLITKKSLKSSLRPYVEKDLTPIYAS